MDLIATEPEIRIATAADERALSPIDLATRSPAVTPAPETGPGHCVFDDRSRPEDTLVAQIDGAAVGYLALRRPTSLPSNRHVLEICGLAVDPTHQGRGIARSLLTAGAREARRRGARRLTLKVLATNPRARRLYEAAGFEVEGVLRGEFLIDGRYVDDVLMALELS